jgi:hypothetical protein
LLTTQRPAVFEIVVTLSVVALVVGLVRKANLMEDDLTPEDRRELTDRVIDSTLTL